MDKQEKRIVDILDEECEDDCETNYGNFIKYYNYLKDNTTFPCLLTGIEDFQWEERYVFGGENQKEYEKLKKTNPSYSDVFELIKFFGPDEDVDEDGDLFIEVKRVSDKKVFELGLSWLKCTDSKSKNYQLLDDFAVWQCNY